MAPLTVRALLGRRAREITVRRSRPGRYLLRAVFPVLDGGLYAAVYGDNGIFGIGPGVRRVPARPAGITGLPRVSR